MWLLFLNSCKRWRPSFPLSSPGGKNKTPRSEKLKRRSATLLCAMILLLNGCAGLTPTRPGQDRTTVQLLPRPALTSLQKTPEGGISMNKHDAAELLIYIESLERAMEARP